MPSLRRSVTVGLCVTVSLLVALAALPARAATVTGATATGSTSIESRSGCSVSLSSSIPPSLNVANWDIVETVYTVSWSDDRTANSSAATSYFRVSVWYPSGGSSVYQEHTVLTTGATSGATVLTMQTQVNESQSMDVEFYVEVRAPQSGGMAWCIDYDTDSGTISFT